MCKDKLNHITVFEHQSILVGEKFGITEFTEQHRIQFERFYGAKGVPYFSLIHNGIRFKEYVGVILVGKLTIEILPKADKTDTDTKKWRNLLIGMLLSVNQFNIHAPSSSELKIKPNSILELYFELFIKEIEYLINKGLIKKYRKTETNSFTLKGNIIFSKQIQENIIHKERFYIKHTTYDNEHIIHQVLFKTIVLLKVINNNIKLKSKIGNLILNFPEVKNIKVTEKTFKRIVLNRKTESYNNAIKISKLLLLNYHPELSLGQNNVLALMFDMNLLWEKFIFISIRKHLPENMTITSQRSKHFWEPKNGYTSYMRPDIVINTNKEVTENIVIDTKWKNIGNSNPSPDDLRQLYVYHEYFNARKAALLYPSNTDLIISGKYYLPKTKIDIDTENQLSVKECSLIKLQTYNTIVEWQKHIANFVINKWIEL